MGSSSSPLPFARAAHAKTGRGPRASLAAGLLCLLLGGAVLALTTHEGSSGAAAASRHSPAAAFARLPLRFEANQGQTARSVRYISRGAGYTLFLTPQETVVSLAGDKGAGAVVRTRLLGANPHPRLQAADRLPGTTNYLQGKDRARWHTGVPGYAQVRYADAYPGIDLVYHGRQGSLEYDFNVAPGADPSRIALAIRGARRLAVDRSGDLVISTRAGSMRQRQPVLYQRIAGKRRPVSGGYVLQGRRQVGFRVGGYDHSRPLVIDPVLAYSTYLGGDLADVALGVAVGTDGSAYVTGFTSSLNFPVLGAFQPQRSPSALGCFCRTDAFVTKLSPDGSALVYSTYLGGRGNDSAAGIAVDGLGRAHVTGETSVESTDFPTTGNAFQKVHAAAGSDAFLSVLSPGGNLLPYSTFLGGSAPSPTGFGSADDHGNQVALDAAGMAYVSGLTCSTDFPTKLAVLPPALQGPCDAFVSKFNPNARTAASTLVASTLLGGGDLDDGLSIAVNASGAYVAGFTLSADFPTQGPVQASLSGFQDAFLTKLSPNLATRLYSTYFGGSAQAFATGVALDASGMAYVAGTSASTDLRTKNAFQPTAPSSDGTADVFLAKFDPTQVGENSLLYSSFLGGTSEDTSADIAVDGAGAVTLAGTTTSPDFPTVDPLAPRANDVDFFVATVKPGGGGLPFLSFSSYLGGGGPDNPRGLGGAVAVDRATGSIYFASETDASDFPTQNALRADAPSGGRGDREDSVVAKITPGPAGAPVVTGVVPRTAPAGTSVVVSGRGLGGATAVRFDGVDADFTVSGDQITAVAPTHALGPAAVTVTTAGGTSAPNPITRFHYAEGRFDATGSFGVARNQAAVTRLADGTVLAIGGCCDPSTGGALASAELYDPASGTWQRTGSLTFARSAPTATLLPSGKVLVAGGGDPSDLSDVLPAELYDPATRTWSTTGSLTVGRFSGHTATLLAGGKVLVVGGDDQASSHTTATAELYDPASGTWSSARTLGAARANHTATLLAGGRVLVAGGAANGPGGLITLASAELYDPASNTWSSTAGMLFPREGHAATMLADGAVMVTGGRGAFDTAQSAEIYSPGTGEWTPTAPMRERRQNHAAVLLPSGKVLLAGGSAGLSDHNSAELYDPATGSFSSEGLMTSYRGLSGSGLGPTALPLDSRRVLIVGGDGANAADLYTLPASPPPVGDPGPPVPPDPPPPPVDAGGTAPAQPTPPAATPGQTARRAGCPSRKNLITGTARKDRLRGTSAGDIVLALAAADVVDGAAGDDCLYGGSGSDRISGSRGSDRLFGEAGNDLLSGGIGSDRLLGGRGSDRLSGGLGADRLNGGPGRDRVFGGAGRDRIDVRDGERDQVNCGKGRDTVLADTRDRVARNCERVARRKVRRTAASARTAALSAAPVKGSSALALPWAPFWPR